MSLVTDVVLGSAPPARAGAVSGLLESATEFAGALGMAVLGSVGSAVYRREIGDSLEGLPAAAADPARETLAGAFTAAGGLPAETAGALLRAARSAFLAGLHAAALVALVLMLLAAALCVLLLRHAAAATPPAPAAAAAPDGAADTAPEGAAAVAVASGRGRAGDPAGHRVSR
ncbi:hypothetical protein [Plantactinospora sp. KBS50]|uniref:hypothetical protein n=1 Tax=Plantactinospora sp. KBS50 TaxID=2024580 RepID=UPI0018DFA69B|nr:hypothetical protein [Plantactinospora sp. KBS50]